MVDSVCQRLAKPPSYKNTLGTSALLGSGVQNSRFSRLYCKRQREEALQDSIPLAYRYAVDGYLQRYNALMATPIPWNGNADENQWHANNRDREIRSLRTAVLAVTDKHAPDALIDVNPTAAAPGSGSTSGVNTSNSATTSSPATLGVAPELRCGVCTNSTSGVCEACQGVVYEHSLNQMYHQHHTIGMSSRTTTNAGSGATGSSNNSGSVSSVCNGVDENQSVSEDHHHHQALVPSSTPTNGSHHHPESGRISSVNMYQRRAQFRLAMAAYHPGFRSWVLNVNRSPGQGYPHGTRCRHQRHPSADRRGSTSCCSGCRRRPHPLLQGHPGTCHVHAAVHWIKSIQSLVQRESIREEREREQGKVVSLPSLVNITFTTASPNNLPRIFPTLSRPCSSVGLHLV